MTVRVIHKILCCPMMYFSPFPCYVVPYVCRYGLKLIAFIAPVRVFEPGTSGQLLRGVLFTRVNGIRITLKSDVNSKSKIWPASEVMCAICVQREIERRERDTIGIYLEPVLLWSDLMSG